MKFYVFIVTTILFFLPAVGSEDMVSAEGEFDDRISYLTKQLRCLVCQNQSIADSEAELAMDLKKQVRELVLAGRSDKEIREFMVSRYGDFILYSPPFKTSTLVLWCGPFVLLIVMLVFVQTMVRRRNQDVSGKSFSEQDLLRARKDINQ